jgi:hypothetical protein
MNCRSWIGNADQTAPRRESTTGSLFRLNRSDLNSYRADGVLCGEMPERFK